MEDIKERADLIKERLNEINLELDNIPSKEWIGNRARVFLSARKNIAKSPKHLSKMSYDDIKKMVISALGGTDLQGNRLGVYVKKDASNIRVTFFTIKGMLPDLQVESKLPMHNLEYAELLDIDTDYQDLNEEVDNFRQNMSGRFRRWIQTCREKSHFRLKR